MFYVTDVNEKRLSLWYAFLDLIFTTTKVKVKLCVFCYQRTVRP